jgi:hypothetical protein
MLQNISFFGNGIQPHELIRPGSLTIIDMSGDFSERIKRALCAILLSLLFKARKSGDVLPFLVIIEEGHRFCPQNESCASKFVIRKLAREGRKFGVSVCITSQRIIGLDKDVLSQCGTKITFRIDSKTDLDYVAPYLSMHSSEFRMIPNLPNGEAIISGVAIRAPIICKIRIRKSLHGGTDVLFTATESGNKCPVARKFN